MTYSIYEGEDKGFYECFAVIKRERTMRKIFIIAIFVVCFLVVFHACGGGDGENKGNGRTGTVALFFTDDLADYQHVIGTITSVRLFHTGTSASCLIVSEPLAYDFTDLANVLQLVREAQCDAVPYNRLELVFEEAVSLTDAAGTSADCTFVSYKDESNQINTLSCSGGSCTLTVNGTVNVMANHEHAIALDFDLKEFEVQPEPLVTGESCTVTMKVSPIHNVDMGDLHNAAISGFIMMDSLDTTAKTFEITKHDITYTIDYSSAAYGGAPQPGIDDLLVVAGTDHLKVRAFCSAFDSTANLCTASTVFVKAEGSVSGLATDTFTLTYGGSKQITVDYSDAAAHNRVEGTLESGVSVEVKLFGFDGVNYLAHEVEVEDGTHIETEED